MNFQNQKVTFEIFLLEVLTFLEVVKNLRWFFLTFLILRILRTLRTLWILTIRNLLMRIKIMMNFMRHLDKPKITSISTLSQCLKIDQKVAFNIASEASYVYILSGQKLIKNAKNGPFGEFLKTWSFQTKQHYQTG